VTTAPSTPPSIEHLAHEARHWANTTQLGRAADQTGAIETVAHNMTTHIPEVTPRAIGTVMLRLASLLANEPDMPTPLVINLIGSAGADLITRGGPE
jgi:hypothetical protein